MYASEYLDALCAGNGYDVQSSTQPAVELIQFR